MLSTWLSKRPVMRKKALWNPNPIFGPIDESHSWEYVSWQNHKKLERGEERDTQSCMDVCTWARMLVSMRAAPTLGAILRARLDALRATDDSPLSSMDAPIPSPAPLQYATETYIAEMAHLSFSCCYSGVSLSLSLSRSKEEKSVKEKQQANLHTYERNSTIPPHLRRFCVCVFLLAPRLWLGEEERLDESAPSTLLIEYFIHIQRMKSM